MGKEQIKGDKFICSECGEEFYFHDATLHEGKLICEGCIKKLYSRCKECDAIIPKGQNYCDRCNDMIYKKATNSYSTKPNLNFKNYNTHTNSNLNTIYYGMELEYNNVNSLMIRTILDDLYNNKFLYNKQDSSVSNGVELVTAPCDLKSIKKLLYNMEDGFDYIKYKHGHDRNAGIHIHVSRNCLPPFSIYKLHKLLNLPNMYVEDDKRAIYFLSGRLKSIDENVDENSFHYCKIGQANENEDNPIIKYKSARFNEDRHSAINLHNKDTIEFRIFKSTTDIETIYSYLEIVNTMIEFVNSYGIDDISISNYIKYLSSNTKNKIILSKIELINTKLKLTHISSIITPDQIYKLLKGLNWSEYGNLTSVNTTYINNGILYKYIKDIKYYRHRSINVKQKADTENKILKDLLNTYKKVLINKILRSKNKCA